MSYVSCVMFYVKRYALFLSVFAMISCGGGGGGGGGGAPSTGGGGGTPPVTAGVNPTAGIASSAAVASSTSGTVTTYTVTAGRPSGAGEDVPLNDGLDVRELIRKTGTDLTSANGLTIALGQLSGTVGGNRTDRSGFFFNGTDDSFSLTPPTTTGNIDDFTLSALVDGAFILNNQTGVSAADKQAIVVTGANKFVIYVKGAAAVTIDNDDATNGGGDLLFRPVGSSYNSTMGGIYAEAGANFGVNIRNDAHIGFAANSTASRGSSYVGIQAKSSLGSGSITVQINNSGVIDVNAGNSDGIVADSGAGTAAIGNSGTINATRNGIRAKASGTGTVTITNDSTGVINLNSGNNSDAFAIEAGTGLVTITNSGQINNVSRYIVSAGATAGGVQFTHSSTSALRGGFVFGSGNDTLTLGSSSATTGTFQLTSVSFGAGSDSMTSYGTLQLNSASFGVGSDSMTSYGVLRVGSSSAFAHQLAITGLENFTVQANSTLELYLNNSAAAWNVNSATARFIMSSATDAPIIKIYLPAGYDGSAPRAAAELINFANLYGVAMGATNITDAQLGFLSGRSEIYIGTTLIRNRLATFGRDSDGDLTVAWDALTGSGPTSGLSCGVTNNNITCTGGNASGADSLLDGITLTNILESAGNPTLAAATTIAINNLTAAVNTTGTGDGIALDASAAGSTIAQDLTINLNTAGTNPRDIEVRGDGTSSTGTVFDAAGVYVKNTGTHTITINNGASTIAGSGNIVFKTVTSGGSTSYNNGLVGMLVDLGGTVTIRNHGRIGFAANDAATSSTGHRGIWLKRSGTGADGTIINEANGVIDTDAGTDSVAFKIESSVRTNITNRGRIFTSGHIVDATGSTGNIHFAQENSNPLQGSFIFGSGQDNMTITDEAEVIVTSLNFGGGGDTIEVKSGGTLQIGSGNTATTDFDGSTITGLETLLMRENSTLELYFSGTSISTIDWRSVDFRLINGQVNIHIYLPSNFPLAAQTTAVNLLRLNEIYTNLATASPTISHENNLSARGRIFVGGQERAASVTFDGLNGIPSNLQHTLTVRWGDLTALAGNRAAGLTCPAFANNVFACTGGATSGRDSLPFGVSLGGIVDASPDAETYSAAVSVNLSNLTGNVGASTENSVIILDATDANSVINQDIIVNLQSISGQSTSLRDVLVTGDNRRESASIGSITYDAAAVYINSGSNDATFNHGNANRAPNILFRAHSGSAATEMYRTHLAGVLIESSGAVTATNYGRIGFRTAVTTTSRGNTQRGIWVNRSGTAATTIHNYGVIDVSGSGTSSANSYGIQVTGGTGTISVTNYSSGRIDASGGNADIFQTTSTGNATFEERSVNNVGTFTFGGGNDTLRVGYNVGSATPTISLDLLGANFGAGSGDTLDVTYGTLKLGDETVGQTRRTANSVSVTNLENLILREDAILELYLNASRGAWNLGTANGFIVTSATDAPTFKIYLPATYALTAQSAFTLINLGNIYGNAPAAGTTNTAITSTQLGRINAEIYIGGILHNSATTPAFTVSSTGNDLQIAWGTLRSTAGEQTNSAGLTCSFTAGNASANPATIDTISCTGGATSGDDNLSDGFNLAGVLEDTTNDAIDGAYELNFSAFTSTVNSSGTGNAISLDATDPNSITNHNMRVRLNTSGVETDIEVRGDGSSSGGYDAAAVYVNAGSDALDFRFGGTSQMMLFSLPSSGTTTNNNLVGIYAESSANSDVISGTPSKVIGDVNVNDIQRVGYETMIDNHGRIGFSDTIASNVTKGTGHRGIWLARAATATGTALIVNHGTIDVTGSSSESSHGFYISGGTGDVNILNYGVVNASGDIVHSTSAGDVNYFHLTTTAASGSFTFGGGDDTVTFGYNDQTPADGGTDNVFTSLTLLGTSDFGAGTDSILMQRGGQLHIGNASNPSSSVVLTGLERNEWGGSLGILEDLNTLHLYVNATRDVWDVNGTATDVIDFRLPSLEQSTPVGHFTGSGNARIHLPASQGTGDQTAFGLIKAKSFRDYNGGGLSGSELTALASRTKIIIGTTTYTGTITFTVTVGTGTQTLNVAWSGLSSSSVGIVPQPVTPPNMLHPVRIGHDVASLQGKLGIKGANIGNGGLLRVAQGFYEYNYRFATPATSDNNTALWQRTLFGNKHSRASKNEFAAGQTFGELSFYNVADRNEASVMAHWNGIFTAFTLGHNGGNDFAGSGIFRLGDAVKARVGYHQCHALTDSTCLLTHASWENQRVKGAGGSFVRDIESEKYDIVIGIAHEQNYKSGLGFKASLYGSFHSALKGNITLGNDTQYNILGKNEQRLATDISISW